MCKGLYSCSASSEMVFFHHPPGWLSLHGPSIERPLDIQSKVDAFKTTIQKDTHTPTFSAALLTITKTWKRPKCPLTEVWIEMMWYINKMEYHAAIKRMK